MRKKLFYLFLLFLVFNITVLGVFINKNSQKNYQDKEQMIENDLTTKYDFNNKDLEFISENKLDVNRISIGETNKLYKNFDLIEGIDYKLLHFYNSNCVMAKLSIPLNKFNSYRYYFSAYISNIDKKSCLINYTIRYKGQEYYLGHRDYQDYEYCKKSSSYDPFNGLLLNNFKIDNFGTYDENVNVNISIIFKITNIVTFHNFTYIDFYLSEEEIIKYDDLYLGFIDFNTNHDYQLVKTCYTRTFLCLEGDK